MISDIELTLSGVVWRTNDFVLRMVAFAIKAAWGISKAILFVIGIPVFLIGLLVSGIVTLAIPLLLVALLGAFLLPVIKQL